MATKINGTNSSDLIGFPQWFQTISLEGLLRREMRDNFVKILSLSSTSDTKPGDIYLSVVWRLNIKIETKDGSTQCRSFMLKVNHDDRQINWLVNFLMAFPKEEEMYHSIIPKFEDIYNRIGMNVIFAPRSYKLDIIPSNVEYIFLEDISSRNFKNANRLVGLNLKHMKAALSKLAQFHAASACYTEYYGAYPDKFLTSVLGEKNPNLLKEITSLKTFLEQAKKWKNCAKYAERLADVDDYLIDCMIQVGKVNSSEFNVLNHGYCWCNNIMFQYDAFGEIRETYFVDFQFAQFGSPAVDLYYLILSSASIEIKLVQFDYMVHYYFEHVIENLKLLGYQRPLPKLRNLHIALLRRGSFALYVVSKMMPAIMLEKTDHRNLETWLQDTSKMMTAMYTDPNYVKAMEMIMPWLDNRGLLDFK